jgi:hypothetical protein
MNAFSMILFKTRTQILSGNAVSNHSPSKSPILMMTPHQDQDQNQYTSTLQGDPDESTENCFAPLTHVFRFADVLREW